MSVTRQITVRKGYKRTITSARNEYIHVGATESVVKLTLVLSKSIFMIERAGSDNAPGYFLCLVLWKNPDGAL